jgi:predicted exporter
VPNSALAAALEAAWRHRRLVLAAAAVAIALGLYALWTVPLDSDVAFMLPADSEVQRSMAFLRESNLSDKIVLSLEIAPDAGGLDALLDASAKLEASLGPPLVTGIESGVSGEAVASEVQGLLRRLPELVQENDLDAIQERLTPQGLDETLRGNYRQLIRPGELFTKEIIRSDPLGLSRRPLEVMQELSASVGYTVEIEQGRFVSPDRRHALLILETPVTITDSAGGRELLSYLRRSLAELPEGVKVDIVAGHLHTISNEDVIQQDLIVGLGAASVGFLALFLFLYRDPRAVMLFLVPAASVVIAIGLEGLAAGRLSAFVVGMGGVIVGIADDYAIHVYMAIRAAGGDVSSVRLVAGPMVAAALTTLSVFLAFLFSSVPGYRHLAVFAVVSITICVVFSLFVLPLIVGGPERRSWSRGILPNVPRLSAAAGSVAIAGWVAIMLAGLLTLRSLDVRTDLRQFDGSEPYVTEAEHRFDTVWGGGGQPAILVASGKTLDGALRQNSALYEEVLAAMGPESSASFGSLAPIWPSLDERAENAARWRSFWRDGREARLRELLAEIGPRYGFAPTAFDPFLERISDEAPPDELEQAALPTLAKRFTRATLSEHQVFSFFPDDARWLAAVRDVAHRHPGAFVVSRGNLASALSRSVSSEVRFIAIIAAFLIPSLTFLLLRSVRLTALALVTVASSLVAMLAVPTVLGWSLTAPAMIAATVVLGLSIDYGIFIVHACDRHINTETTAAVTLSSASTLIGTGALMLSRHPVLFSIGFTMFTGITAAYASSVLVVPALYDRFVRPAEGR